MPIFEYECRSCGNAFEKLVPNSASKVKCDKCNSEEVDKQLSTFSARIGASCGRKSNCASADTPHCCSGGCKHH